MEDQQVTPASLMNLGRRHAATVIRSQCVNYQSTKMLNELLDIILNPAIAIDDRGNIDWCRWLMAGGRTPDDFTATVRRYDNATTCGLVWTADFVAYRCRTCGISPCMSLCAECFQRGNHDGHDFNMFRSQAGGACDCGDTSVMKDSGFCDRHGSNSQENIPTAPAELLCVTEAAMPRIILRLIHYLRERSKLLQDSHTVAIHDVDAFLTMLNDFSAMGAAVRRVMARALTSPEVYRELTDVSALPNPLETEKIKYMRESQRTYEEAVRSLPNPPPPPEYKDIAALQEVLVHRTFLEELVFWTVKFEFPQKVVCLLLNMLRDPDCKEALTQAFVLHYSRISMMLEKSTDPDRLSNRVVHVSVQLFSNEALALHVAEKLNLLHVMVISLRYMMRKILIRNTLHDPALNFHYVVDCGRQVMKEHCYWPLVSDLNNVLSHRPVAVKFMSDDALLEMWFMFLSMFQGMNVNQRELSTHIEFEPNTYYAAFSAELEASAYPMWALLSHLRDTSSVELTHRVLNAALNALQDWFDNIHISHPNLVDNLQVSFHLPLHRYLAVFMCQAINMQGRSLSDVLPPANMLQLIMIHPLRVQVAFYEILNGLWVRNGLQIKGQAMTYIQCNFCNSMVDADLYLLQVCAMMLPSQFFLVTVLQRFHVLDWLSISNQVRSTPMSDTDSDTPMLESCLIFLASLISLRTNLGANQTRLSQLEMVTLLCMGDKTHSQLMELMPERCGTVESRDFESVLEEVAEYRAPNLEASGNMQQGMYVPKGNVWENLYDPIHVLLRAVHRREFQNSMDRFNEYVSQSGKMRAGTSAWPPYREPAPIHSAYSDPRKILKSRVFHALVWLVLFKATRWQQSVSEHVISLVVYLLEMALAVSAGSTGEQNLVCTVKQSAERNVFDGDLENYFESDWLSDNLRTVINTVTLPPQAEVLLETDSDQEWEEDISTRWRATDEDDTLSIDWIQPPSIDGPNLVPLGWAGQPLALVAGTEVVPFSGASTAAEAASGSSQSPSSSQSNPPIEGAIMTLASKIRARLNRPNSHPSQGLQPLPPPGSPGPPDPSLGTNFRSLPWPADKSNEPAVGETPAPATGSSDAAMASVAGMSDSPMPERPPSSSQNSSPNADSGNQIVLAPPAQPHRKMYKHRHAPKEQNYQMELPSPDNTVEANESIISLLLKLHSHLAGVPDSFIPDSPAPDPNCRIGDGPYFVGNVLHRIMALDSLCREQVVTTRERLWPRHPEEGEDGRREREEKERDERRRRAKERQQKLMEEFASKQKQFMQRAMETDEEGMEWDGNEGGTSTGSGSGGGTSSRPITRRKEYDCVICNQTSPSTEDKPMGLAVLVQATSVLGHRRRNPEPACLPTSDAEKEKFKRNDTQACYFDRQVEEFNRQFCQLSWMVSVNLGWEGGVHVQTCGHHLHLDCLKSYLMSLRSQQRLSSERGEYACPLCRQMANSVLPLPPQLGEMASMVRSRPSSPSSIILELTSFLRENPLQPQQPQSNLTEAMGKAMEDMTNATYLKYKHKSHSRLPQTLFLFVSSIARTNLEIELVQRGGSLLAHQPNPLIPKRSCIVPLLHVLAVHARMLAHWPVWETWQKLGSSEGGYELIDFASLSNRNAMYSPDFGRETTDMPMLLRDPTALLTQFIMLLPLHLDQTYFTCITKLLYNLLYYQVVIQMTCQMSEGQRAYWRSESDSKKDWGLHCLEGAVVKTIRALDPSQLYSDDDDGAGLSTVVPTASSAVPTASSSASSSPLTQTPRSDLIDKQFLELQIQTLCLPFLRVAALLRHYMYDQPLPEIDSPSSEFVSLVYYLELVTDGMSWEQFNAAVALSRPLPLGEWLYDLHQFINSNQVAARGLLSDQHVIWHQPSLLSLPNLYDRIFQYYHRKQCNQCQGVPRETSICLLCGALVCLKEACCKRLSICEAVQHSIDCGAGTAMFLVVTSSYVIVIRGKRACLWGSVYLDSFGEEDRELKRGKPLYISPGRYQLLQQQWIAHRFDHTNKKWVWHRDAL